jgi:hypothetical protein
MKKILLLLSGSLFFIAVSYARPAATLPAIARPAIARPDTVLTGLVTDSANAKAIPGCSVYLNNTSLGAVTRSDGTFLLKDIPAGKSTLIISAIGYKTFTLDIDGNNLPPPLKVRLRQRVTQLSAVTVEPSTKGGWGRYGKDFIDNFIGTTANSWFCSIRNRKALRFYFSKKDNRLSVWATEPLMIENTALGYDLQYQLEDFSLDYNTQTVLYLGYPLFRELTTDRKHREQRWIDNRRKAWRGSLHHFLRSLYYDCPFLRNFSMELPVMVMNPEKLRIKGIFNPAFSPDNYPKDSLIYYRKINADSNYIVERRPVVTNDIVGDTKNGSRYLYFSGTLGITWRDDKSALADQYSELKLLADSTIFIEADGNYYPTKALLATGYWSFTEKICNLLPNYYQPE